jgi:hypothetical protein
MLAELDVLVFLKSHDDLDRTAERVFGALGAPCQPDENEEFGGPYYRASGLGFEAALYANAGEVQEPEFETYQYALEVSSTFWCVDLDTVDLEGPLSEYYARLLAFELNVETATEILLETTEEAEVFTALAYRRNPQYRLDQAPTTPKVFVLEERQITRPFEDEWEEDETEGGDNGEAV